MEAEAAPGRACGRSPQQQQRGPAGEAHPEAAGGGGPVSCGETESGENGGL